MTEIIKDLIMGVVGLNFGWGAWVTFILMNIGLFLVTKAIMRLTLKIVANIKAKKLKKTKVQVKKEIKK